MAATGIKVLDNDLGERIQQLDGEYPSHIVVPAVHKLRTDVAAVFARQLTLIPATMTSIFSWRDARLLPTFLG